MPVGFGEFLIVDLAMTPYFPKVISLTNPEIFFSFILLGGLHFLDL